MRDPTRSPLFSALISVVNSLSSARFRHSMTMKFAPSMVGLSPERFSGVSGVEIRPALGQGPAKRAGGASAGENDLAVNS